MPWSNNSNSQTHTLFRSIPPLSLHILTTIQDVTHFFPHIPNPIPCFHLWLGHFQLPPPVPKPLPDQCLFYFCLLLVSLFHLISHLIPVPLQRIDFSLVPFIPLCPPITSVASPAWSSLISLPLLLTPAPSLWIQCDDCAVGCRERNPIWMAFCHWVNATQEVSLLFLFPRIFRDTDFETILGVSVLYITSTQQLLAATQQKPPTFHRWFGCCRWRTSVKKKKKKKS